ncbi:putative metallophosphoesterase [Pseudomonas phage Ep4]|uniref:Metallophosphoesterase n=1 Tax=Pseudomonas phage Ep4 TaxID=3057492 RepID=A0AAU9EAB2_9CAUD|nr:putative metallophosphoesterase [Pseudomonas phage Ep4]
MAALMKLLTKNQHIDVLSRHEDNNAAAEVYAAAMKQPVTRQNVAYWRRIFLESGSKAKANNLLVEHRVLRQPEPGDDVGDTSWVPDMARRIMVIGDMHFPYQHPDIDAFLAHVDAEYNPDLHVQIGDETDGHALSFHESDPNLDSAGVELEKAKEGLERIHAAFPRLLICHSNHGSLVYRRAKYSGIPIQMIKSYREILFPTHNAPGWSWAFNWRINTPTGPVLFRHQTSGAALDAAAAEGCHLVVGHEHGKFGAQWGATSMRLFFGAYTGCLIDKDSLAYAYGKVFPRKPIIGVLMIIEGVPVNIPMIMGEDGRWIGPQ